MVTYRLDETFHITGQCLWTGLPVLIPENEESVLLGAAILAACASQEFPNIQVQYVTLLRILG